MKNDFISSSNIKMKTGYSDILVEVDDSGVFHDYF